MASSRTLFLLLCALFALVFILTSEVSTLDAKEETNSVEESQHGGGYRGGSGGGEHGGPDGGRCRYGCCHRYRYGCRRCCANANEVPDTVFEDDPKH